MRKLLAALLLVTACGSGAGQGSLPLPSPPTEALSKWSNFPAHANPRPIVSFGETIEHIPQAGFPNGDRKMAWGCNMFVFASGVKPSTDAPNMAIVGVASYPGISSARAYLELMAARSANAASSGGCQTLSPFVISEVRWGTAGFPTDRGMVTMSAWLFDVPEINAFIGHSAVDPSAYWGGGVSTEGRGGRISWDGRTLQVGVGNTGPGPCEADYTAAAAESDTAVAVALKRIPHSSPGQAVACDLVLRVSYISVALKAPLDNRVLVDEQGNPGMVCPEDGAC